MYYNTKLNSVGSMMFDLCYFARFKGYWVSKILTTLAVDGAAKNNFKLRVSLYIFMPGVKIAILTIIVSHKGGTWLTKNYLLG